MPGGRYSVRRGKNLPLFKVPVLRAQRAYLSLLLAIVVSVIGLSCPAGARVAMEVVKLSGKNISVPAYGWADTAVKPTSVLIAIHGGVQHAGSFRALAEQLAPRGILIYSIDLRGYGEWLATSSTRPALNYLASTDDVVEIASQLRKEHPGLPIFCIGESLGAAVGLRALSYKPQLFDGLILCSPGTTPSTKAAWRDILISVREGVTSLGTSIDLSGHLKRISEDPRSCAEMIDDPRNRNQASVPELFRMANFVRQNGTFAKTIDRNVPVLVLQGTEDHICSPQSAAVVFAKLASSDKSLKTFEGCGHLLATTAYLKPEVITAIEQWLALHTTSSQIAHLPTKVQN